MKPQNRKSTGRGHVNKPRAHVPFNTGTRVHKTGKGKGSYSRKGRLPEETDAYYPEESDVHLAPKSNMIKKLADEIGYECVDVALNEMSYTEWMEQKNESYTDPEWSLCRPRTKAGMQERYRRDQEIESTLISIEEEVIRSAEKIAAMMARIRKNL